MAVTMHDVAHRAGVSIKTVSNVVNQYPHVRPETRRRVEEAIAELGYRLNTTARNLRQGRTGMIGLALPELSLPYFAELADSVMRAAEARGVVVLIEQTGAQRDRELQALDSSHRRLTDGLLFSPLALEPEETERLEVDYPMVLLGERMFGPVDHVTMANVEAARAATLHLVERGCRRIATIGAHPGETMGSARLRFDGYRKALAEAGLPFDPDLVGDAGLWHRSTGAEAMTRLLDAGVELDGVFGMNDALALGALHVLHTRGVAVPHDVAVMGFDDVDDARYSEPLLSTIDPGREQIATTAVDLLLERIAGSQVPPRRVVADFEIVARESCLLGRTVH
ncbi:LacI family DNA-binding transcriptional regulator [Isoptericola chiayiensis]|uniref:LacI family DNA-binding transcriptional regulator n=1 Tax=Isoptericola chiayiensis TaxID=579446 RepID=A0ABP8YT68_9MICO|nr:LacI family DNA-binding transcriptional regulator [Isoptericola chiayiensis]NOW02341.1 DNA-binding LacI/PurR family transcriptional regulator [Isoptericola chiayiensis]